MRFLPFLLLLLAVVVVLAGAGGKGLKAAQSIGLVILGLGVAIILFSLVVARAL